MATTKSDLVCAGCGCACDDLAVQLGNGFGVELEIDCDLGRAWFSDISAADEPLAFIAGKPAEPQAAAEVAARLLASAKAPLVAGLTHSTCEAQLAAVDLAERLGGTIDPFSVPRGLHGTLLQNVGLATASFGELRDRADLLVLWHIDPSLSYPRLFERYAPRQMPIAIEPADDLAAVAVLRALLRDLQLDESAVLSTTGQPLDYWRDLLRQIRAAKYPAIVLPEGNVAAAREALARFVRELNDHTRAIAICLSPGNAAGAAQVLTARTGYPCCVNFATGAARFDPQRFSAESLLARSEVDVLLVVGDALSAKVGKAAQIVIGSHRRATSDLVAVDIRTARPGVECGGTIFRADGIALPLRKLIDSQRPSDEEVLREVIVRL